MQCGNHNTPTSDGKCFIDNWIPEKVILCNAQLSSCYKDVIQYKYTLSLISQETEGTVAVIIFPIILTLILPDAFFCQTGQL